VSQALLGALVALLLGGFGYAAVSDLRNREVTDRLWQILGIVGWVLGAVVVAPGGAVPVALWTLVGGFALQHMFPWDDLLGAADRFADLIEGAVYLAVILVVLVAAVRWGVGPAAVPIQVVALLVTVLFARALFEIGVLYGGADAKAIMIAGLLVPIFSSPLLPQSSGESLLLSVVPFPVNILVDAALLSVTIPIGIAARNLARGEFEFPRGFSGYTIPVRELPERFVWLKDPLLARGEDEAETSEEDREIRVRAARELEARGVERVWVTPQIPFLVLLAVGAVAALLAGNLILDIFAAV
jgi:archaeal preflagellin peptidase FlaK